MDNKKKKVFVKDLQAGMRLDEMFLVKGAKLGETRAKKPYLLLTLMDKSGEIPAPIWEDALQYEKITRPGTVLYCRAVVQSYQESLQLRLEKVEVVAKDEVDLYQFLLASPRRVEEMEKEMRQLLGSISDPYLARLLRHFFDGGEIWQQFRSAPAAKGVHHAYLGGLFEHSLSVATLAATLAEHYPGVNRSLLIAGALLHDIGKLDELCQEVGAVDYTSPGRLKGHLVIGSEMVGRASLLIESFPKKTLEQLQHLILSHHGRLEFGSPVVPMTVEAFILSLIDDLDAKMNLIEQLRSKMETEELSWTQYQRILERYLYLGGLPAEKEQPEPKKGREKLQQSLF